MSMFIGCDASWDDCNIVLFGAPFDGTVTNRPGTRFAPAQIRLDSYGLETYSPYFEMDLEELKIHDAGDLDLPFGSTEMALSAIADQVAKILEGGHKPLMIGGEHLVSLPAIQEVYKRYHDLCVIHFDAHTDLRKEYMGIALSHSTVLYNTWKFLGDNRIWQFGIRSGTKEEFLWARGGHTDLTAFDFSGLQETVSILGNRPVYLTIDLDVLDPAFFPGTGTPEPGGVTFKELMGAFTAMNGLNIVGADVVELSPHYDQSGVSTAVACKTLREVICLMNLNK